MDLRCCINCFAHEWLHDFVRDNSDSVSDCDYCGSKGVEVIEISELCGSFENLMELYVRSDDPHGEMLVDLIQWDYQVFEEDLYSPGNAARLLEDILRTGWDDDSGESPVDAHELYYRRSSAWFHTTMAEEWEGFCYEVKRDPKSKLNLPELFDEDLARMAVKLPSSVVFYRARIGFKNDAHGSIQPFEGADIGAPPPEKARASRANEEGEIVLYATDQEHTAIAEVRPWRGLLVSVAEINVVRDLRLADLSKPPPPTNPFTDEAPQYELEFAGLLLALGEELGRPLRRVDDPRDYVPCQKLVKRIRESGLYDGIRYPSAMAPGGTNVVVFDPKLAGIGPSKLVEVQQTGISYDAFENDHEV